MNGKIMVSYKILCKTDVNNEVSMKELLSNEKILKAIKSEYSKGIRNIEISSDAIECSIKIYSQKEVYNFEANKNDYADLLVLAEEDATNKKLLKKDCDRVELVDIETMK